MVPRILLYSPDVVGHPRVYCRVIADALQGLPCELVIAMGFSDAATLQDSPDLHPLAQRAGVQLVDTRQFSSRGSTRLSAEELVAMQERFGISTTLFIEADKSKDEFLRIASGAAPHLHGRTLGIFANTAEWYPGEDSFTGERKTLRAKTLRTTLGNIKRALFNRRDTARHFYERSILGARVLDEVLVKDERLADWHGAPVYWMPEISRPAPAIESAEDAAEFEQRKTELGKFLTPNAALEPVLYFGDAAPYKGYDLFLHFVASTPGVCGVHAGRTYDPRDLQYFRCDVEALRSQLRSEGRLLETNDYVHTQRLKELYFGCVRVYLTTHRLALSSSTMIQALELGKPVLVPDRGLIGHRVRTQGLGAVYRYEDLADLRRRAESLWNSDLSRFAAPARGFWQKFSDDAIRAFFAQRLLPS
jgi:glycosyltransferase involved in cell wall biosynthesis